MYDLFVGFEAQVKANTNAEIKEFTPVKFTSKTTWPVQYRVVFNVNENQSLVVSAEVKADQLETITGVEVDKRVDGSIFLKTALAASVLATATLI